MKFDLLDDSLQKTTWNVQWNLFYSLHISPPPLHQVFIYMLCCLTCSSMNFKEFSFSLIVDIPKQQQSRHNLNNFVLCSLPSFALYYYCCCHLSSSFIINSELTQISCVVLKRTTTKITLKLFSVHLIEN